MNLKKRLSLMMLGVWMSAVSLAAEEAGPAASRTFTDNRGRTIVASVVSINVTSVVLRRESDKKEFTLPIVSLSPADQAFLAENRAELGKLSSAGKPSPLPYRKITGPEVAKARRFAVDVLIPGTSGKASFLKWEQRPRLTLKGSAAEQAAFGKKTFEDFCDAAGLVEVPNADSEIILCAGTREDVTALGKELGDVLPPGQIWFWRWRSNYPKPGKTAFVLIVVNPGEEDLSAQNIFRTFSSLFGCGGRSKEFPQSGFGEKKLATELSPVDRQLLRLLYTYLPESATRDDIIEAVQKNWASMVGPAPAGTPADAAR